MIRFMTLATMSLAFLIPATAHASMEGMLPMSIFSIESAGLGESGSVSIQGKQNEKGITELTVKAFDQTYNLDKPMLAALSGFTANGLQISYEGGWKETGGHTLYLQFSQGFISGIKGKRFIVINQQGQVRIDDKLDEPGGLVQELGSLLNK